MGGNVINVSLTRFRTAGFGIEIAIEVEIEPAGIAAVFDFDSDPDFDSDDLNQKSISLTQLKNSFFLSQNFIFLV